MRSLFPNELNKFNNTGFFLLPRPIVALGKRSFHTKCGTSMDLPPFFVFLQRVGRNYQLLKNIRIRLSNMKSSILGSTYILPNLQLKHKLC